MQAMTSMNVKSIVLSERIQPQKHMYYVISFTWNPGGSDSKASAYNVGGLGSIPGLGRSPGERNGNPLQYYCLENPMEGGAW